MRTKFDVGYICISFILILGVKQTTRIKIELRNVICVANWKHQLHSLIQF